MIGSTRNKTIKKGRKIFNQYDIHLDPPATKGWDPLEPISGSFLNLTTGVNFILTRVLILIEANQANICYPEQSEKFYTRYDMTWSNLNYFRPPSEKFPYAVYITWLSVKFKHTAEHCVTYKYMTLINCIAAWHFILSKLQS